MHNVCAQVSDWPNICRRAGGRRHYNRVRQFRAVQRRAQLAPMLRKEGLRWGYQTRLAAKLGVSPSTISRDMLLLRLGLPYQRHTLLGQDSPWFHQQSLGIQDMMRRFTCRSSKRIGNADERRQLLAFRTGEIRQSLAQNQ